MLVERDEEIRSLLQSTDTIAVIGCSPHAGKAGNMVPAYLQEMGYQIIPVNPEYHEVLGEKCYASLRDIPGRIDMVECFIPSDAVSAIAEDAIAIGAKVLWMQLGVINKQAAERASDAGLKVVMNRCPHIEIPRLFDID